MRNCFWITLLLFVVGTANLPVGVQAESPEYVLAPDLAAAIVKTESLPDRSAAPIPGQLFRRDGTSCSRITFEGLGNVQSIGTVAGIPKVTFGPSWLSIIDEDAGGSGNIANEPSPSTVAFFLEPADPITFDTFVHFVEVYYSASSQSIPVRLDAWDGPAGTGRVVDTAVGSVQGTTGCSGDPTGNFCRWARIELSSQNNDIRSITLSGAVVNQFAFDDMTYCSGLDPIADFTWDPAEPTPNTAVQFTDESTGPELSYAWDFDGDGVTDSNLMSPTFVFVQAGSYPVTLNVQNAFGEDSITQDVVVGGDEPFVKSVQRQYEGVFLEGIDEDNRFDIEVEWQGDPGRIEVFVNRSRAQTITATGPHVSYTLDLGFLPSSTEPSEVHITPINGADVRGAEHKENVFVLPYPAWLTSALSLGGDIRLEAGGGEVVYSVDIGIPDPPWREGCTVACALNSGCSKCSRIPSWVPLLGGTLDILETGSTLTGSVSSQGTGGFQFSGKTGFFALGGGRSGAGLQGSFAGRGQFSLTTPGFRLLEGSGDLRVAGVLARQVGLIDAIPQLTAFSGLPVLKQINEAVRITGQVSPSVALAVVFREHGDQQIHFDRLTGTFGLDLKATVSARFTDDVKAAAWMGGGGSFTLGLPEPLFRGGEVHVEAGLTVEVFFFEVEAIAHYQCTYRGGWSCGRDTDDLVAQPLRLIETDYAAFGDYAAFDPQPLPRSGRGLAAKATQEVTLVQNLYPEASPALAELANGRRLVLWVDQDTSLPVLQSTELSWSEFDGSHWSTPRRLTDDRRADLNPQLAVDENGNAVAVWSRIRDANFSAPIEDLDDLDLFARRLDLYSQTYNPNTGFWSSGSPIGSDDSYDADARLSRAPDGRLMLSWLSNSGGELVSTAARPSVLKASFWNADTRSWSSPMVLAGNLVGVATHSAAYSGSQALVLVSRDLNVNIDGDEVLDLYRFTGGTWQANLGWITGGGGNQRPQVIYDRAGRGQLVWLRGGDLVQATIVDPTPALLRQGSASLGFFDIRFLDNASGNLTLIWQEVADNGPANVYARVYDTVWDRWSEDLRLTEEAEVMHRSLNGSYGDDGVLRAAYLATKIDRTQRQVEIDGIPSTFTNIPVRGRTDLRVFEHSLVVDLAVSDGDLQATPQLPVLGDEVAVTLTVRNEGDFATGAFDVRLYVGEPGSGGQQVASRRIAAPFRAGEVAELELTSYSRT